MNNDLLSDAPTVNVRIWITEADGREVEVEQTVPVPNDNAEHVLEALQSTVVLARHRYELRVQRGVLPPVTWTFRQHHEHSWARATGMRDSFCLTCGTVKEDDA